MPYLLLSGSVCAHVIWNLLARRHQPSTDFLWWAVGLYVLLASPLMVTLSSQLVELWPYILVTGLLNGAYFIALGDAYHHIPAAVAYPLARSSPLVLILVDVLLLDTALSASTVIAIALSVAGLVLLATTVCLGQHRHLGLRGLLAALTAALCTAGYSVSDALATQHGVDTLIRALGYVAATFVIAWGCLCGYRRLSGQPWAPPRPPVAVLCIGAACIGGAYALVICALRYLPVSVTVTWTNAGIVITVLLAIMWLRERDHLRWRLAAVSLTVLGLVLLAWSTGDAT